MLNLHSPHISMFPVSTCTCSQAILAPTADISSSILRTAVPEMIGGFFKVVVNTPASRLPIGKPSIRYKWIYLLIVCSLGDIYIVVRQ